jgi:23S rRNA (guanine745-N1)-methyltransferase
VPAPVTYRCPLCGEPLPADDVGGGGDGGFGCANGHRFDRAKEGYVNLLVGGRLKGRPSGDDESMVRARRTVFDAGLYAPIIEAVADAAAEIVMGIDGPTVLDCGCGEGAYLARAAERGGADGWGIDISKPAVRLAARRHRAQQHAVASSYALPFADGSFDAVLSVFSPRPFTEITRVLADGGASIVVRPGPDHLAELKALIYDDPRQHRDATDDGEGWPATADVTRSICFDLDLRDPVLRMALLEMTPYWWSTTLERRAVIAEQPLSLTADVRLSVFRRPTPWVR